MNSISKISYNFGCEEAQQLFEQICQEFEDLGDCIWKFNEQIDTLWAIEADKILNTDSRIMARSRFVIETRKLTRTFPLVLNYSFVTTTFSLFERYLRRICDLVQAERDIPISSRHIAGGIVSRAFLYLEKFCGITRTQLHGFHAIDMMALIRHCIVHTAGYLDDYGDAPRLEKGIAQGEHLLEQHKHLSDYVRVRALPDGLRLWFSRDYSHLTPSYCREFLIGLLISVSLAERSEHEA